MVSLPPADPDAIHEWGLGVMKEFGLSSWSLKFNRRVSSYGLCRYFRRRLELSIHLVRSGLLSEIKETLLHEIAHALVGRGHGHGPVWKAKAREIGAKPRACGDAVMPVPPGRWVAACPGCRTGFRRHGKPRARWHCRSCGQEKGMLAWNRAS